jgi:signal transduction histidine kinase
VTLSSTMRDRIRWRIDLAVFLGCVALTAVGIVQLIAGSSEPVLGVMAVAAVAVCALLGLLGRAPWTPVAYVGLGLIANLAYVAAYGPWFGLGSIYVLMIALACLFFPRWVWIVAAGFAAPPLAIGVLVELGVMTRLSLSLGDVHQWSQAAFASITGQVGAAVIVSYTVGELVRERRALERASALEREQRLERTEVEDRIGAARRADAIARLAAEVGSDIGKALVIVQARADALRRELVTVDAIDCLNDIREASGNAASTMRSLTAFGPALELAPNSDATEAVQSLSKLVRRTLPARIELAIEAEPDLHVGIAPSDLQRICANLVLNARDAILGSDRSAGTIVVQLTRDQEAALLTVRDDGMGMSEATLAQLCTPFFTTKPVGRGTGLGLATTKILVERAGGVLSVTSELGVGSVFVIRLPLCAV